MTCEKAIIKTSKFNSTPKKLARNFVTYITLFFKRERFYIFWNLMYYTTGRDVSVGIYNFYTRPINVFVI